MASIWSCLRPVIAERRGGSLSLNPSGPVLASVGWLIQRKGHDLAIRAAALLPEATLLIVGEGPEDAALRRLAQRTRCGQPSAFPWLNAAGCD